MFRLGPLCLWGSSAANNKVMSPPYALAEGS
jgi:hypothetical protein